MVLKLKLWYHCIVLLHFAPTVGCRYLNVSSQHFSLQNVTFSQAPGTILAFKCVKGPSSILLNESEIRTTLCENGLWKPDPVEDCLGTKFFMLIYILICKMQVYNIPYSIANNIR